MKKIYLYLIILGIFGTILPNTVFADPILVPAANQPTEQSTGVLDGIQPYRTLVRLPGLPAVIDPSIADGGAGSFTLPSYIRTIIRIAIGIIGVLSVVMIVIAGIQYMGSDMITEKEDARSRLKGAVFGLILAVSSVMILRTINPQLVNIRIGDERFNQGVDLEVDRLEMPPELKMEYDSVEDVSGNTPGCSGSMISINTATQQNILVCSSVEAKFKQMIAKAKADGVILTAYGGRTMAAQIALRKQNCGPTQNDIYNKPSSQCSPPTAKPGKSRHQAGVAFDFHDMCYPKPSSQCTNNPRFTWLKNNAAQYGFYNLPSEAWHWSVDGK